MARDLFPDYGDPETIAPELLEDWDDWSIEDLEIELDIARLTTGNADVVEELEYTLAQRREAHR